MCYTASRNHSLLLSCRAVSRRRRCRRRRLSSAQKATTHKRERERKRKEQTNRPASHSAPSLKLVSFLCFVTKDHTVERSCIHGAPCDVSVSASQMSCLLSACISHAASFSVFQIFSLVSLLIDISSCARRCLFSLSPHFMPPAGSQTMEKRCERKRQSSERSFPSPRVVMHSCALSLSLQTECRQRSPVFFLSPGRKREREREIFPSPSCLLLQFS